MIRCRLFIVAFLLLISIFSGGCDLILRVLEREMAEEKELFGDVYGYNSKVKGLQKILENVGYDPGAIDGQLGFRTRSVLKAFQKDYGLKVTGYADKKTWEVLNRICDEEFDFDKVDIRQVQSALQKAGFDPGPIDGKLGPKTKKAIKKFQKSKGLTQNGEVDSKIWKELRK